MIVNQSMVKKYGLISFVRLGYENLVGLFLQLGVNVNLESYNGQTSLYFASLSGELKIKWIIIQNQNDLRKFSHLFNQVTIKS